MMYLNSIILTFGCTFLSLFSCSATAYVLSKYDFPGKSAMYTAAIVIMMIPTMGSMAAMYRLYNQAHLINTYTGIFITAMGGFGSGFLLLYGFFKNLSWTYAEAAQIDGAGHFRIFFIVMIPIAVPALVSVGVLQAIGYWNDYFTIYMYAPAKATIAYGIQRISSEAGVNMPRVFAAMMLSIVPVLVVFACFQKTIMKNTALTYGAKGIQYFTGVLPSNGAETFTGAMFDRDGNRTDVYDYVKKANTQVKAVDEVLMCAKSKGIIAEPRTSFKKHHRRRLVLLHGPGR